MKAIVKKTDGTYLEEIPKPIMAMEEALIQVVYAWLCRTDLYVSSGKIQTQTPLILGHEFSGIVQDINSNTNSDLRIWDKVAIMPILQDKNGYYTQDMLWVDMNGGFAEFSTVPLSMLYKISDNMDMQKAAFVEPIASSTAVLDSPINPTMKGLIQWNSRISQLTLDIMKLENLNPNIFSDSDLNNIEDDSYDYIIETFINNDNIDNIIRILKPGGLLILKSRSYFAINIPTAKLVKKDIQIFSKYYGDFQKAIDIASKLNLETLFGEQMTFEEFIKVFQWDNYDESKKLFLKL